MGLELVESPFVAGFDQPVHVASFSLPSKFYQSSFFTRNEALFSEIKRIDRNMRSAGRKIGCKNKSEKFVRVGPWSLPLNFVSDSLVRKDKLMGHRIRESVETYRRKKARIESQGTALPGWVYDTES